MTKRRTSRPDNAVVRPANHRMLKPPGKTPLLAVLN
jgi:hypothetical protein